MPRSLDLDPPPGFEPATGIDGFVRPSDQSSIVLREMPAPVAELTAGFEDESRVEQEGLELLAVEPFEVGGRSGRLFTFARGGEPGPRRQWTLALGAGEVTALVVVDVPAVSAKREESAIRASLGSLRWDPQASDQLFAGQGFRVQTDGFAYRRRVGELVMLGDRDPASGADGVVVLGPSASQGMCIVNRERFAVKRLHDQVVRVFETRSHGAVEVAGLHGFRTVAEVESLDDAHEDERRLAAQVVLFPDTDYFVFWVEAALEDTRTVERFDEVVGSLVRLDPDGAPLREVVAPPREAAKILAEAFELALENPEEDARSLGDRLARARVELDGQWAAAYAAEALFLRQSVILLAPVFDGAPGTPLHLGTALRQRFPGFEESTYARALADAEDRASGAARSH